jgi:hypothetical protein
VVCGGAAKLAGTANPCTRSTLGGASKLLAVELLLLLRCWLARLSARLMMQLDMLLLGGPPAAPAPGLASCRTSRLVSHPATSTLRDARTLLLLLLLLLPSSLRSVGAATSSLEEAATRRSSMP